MDGSEFLQVAEEWVAGDTEAEWRSAVSRAYYGAFHVTRTFLLDCGFRVPQSEQAHAFVSRRVSNSNYPELVEAGRQLNDLRSARNMADYDLDLFFKQAKAWGEVTKARQIIEIIQLVAQEPAVKAKITDAIKTYERDVLRQVTWK